MFFTPRRKTKTAALNPTDVVHRIFPFADNSCTGISRNDESFGKGGDTFQICNAGMRCLSEALDDDTSGN